jgi:hypothetical protein
MVSESHSSVAVSVRSPPLDFRPNASHYSQFIADVIVANSGYRTQYPQVAVTTLCSTEQEEGLSLCLVDRVALIP